jgi:hypothetical protein
MAREIDTPPETPREEMWANIVAGRSDVGRRRRSRTAELPRWSRWALPAAALLALGIGIGRMSALADRRPATGAGEAPVAIAPATDDAPGSLAYRVAALQHLTNTEALLASFPHDVRAGRSDDVSRWARNLLTDTRLLIDSPAGADPQMSKLLEDLELVLAQIANLSGQQPPGELQLIQDGIHHNDVLLRLRAATQEPALTAT